jgi:hypothetical protein
MVMFNPNPVTPVNHPQPVRVSTDANGCPTMLQLHSRCLAVEEVHARWEVEAGPSEERHQYFLVRLASGFRCCVFFASSRHQWYRQRIAQKSWEQRLPDIPPRHEGRTAQ